MPEVSICIPSIFPVLAEKAVRKLLEKTDLNIDFEIVVLCREEIKNNRVKWIKDNNPKGVFDAYQTCFENTTGTFVCTLADDRAIHDGWLNHALDVFKKREKNQTYLLSLLCNNRLLGTCFGRLYANYPFLRRETALKIGGLFRRDYRAHFGDPDLAMRVWNAGGVVEFTPNVCVSSLWREGEKESPYKFTSFNRDLKIFLRHWKNTIGRDWSCKFLRDFNLDIPLQLHYKVVRHYSINKPSPRFAKQIRGWYRRKNPKYLMQQN